MVVKKRKTSAKKNKQKHWHAVPLKGSFMATAMVGFLVTIYLVKDPDYRLAFLIVFVTMFIASLVSMTKAPLVDGLNTEK